jgi:hypothetical protein
MFYYRTDLTPSKKKPNVLLPDRSYTIQEEAKCFITGQILHHPRRSQMFYYRTDLTPSKKKSNVFITGQILQRSRNIGGIVMYILIIHLMKTLTETNAQLWREVVIWS